MKREKRSLEKNPDASNKNNSFLVYSIQEQFGPGLDLLANSATKNWKLLRGWLSVVRSTNKFAYERQNMRISLIPVMKLN